MLVGVVDSKVGNVAANPLAAVSAPRRDGDGAALDVAPEEADDQVRQRFVELYRALFPPVYGFIRFRVGDLHAAEDLTAQVFERALGRLATVRRPERVRAWLFAIARNAVADYRRRRRPAVELEQVDTLEHLLVDSPEDEALRREEWRRLVSHLAMLSDRERELIGLRFAGGLSHREVGQVVGLSEANVAQIVHRAVARLRARFDAEEVNP